MRSVIIGRCIEWGGDLTRLRRYGKISSCLFLNMPKDLGAVFDECKRIMGDGRFPECVDALKSEKCNGCCVIGSLLFNGEELREVPKGVEVVGQRVTNCLQNGVCAFSGRYVASKPLICSTDPVLGMHLTDFHTKDVEARYNDDGVKVGPTACPVVKHVSMDFRRRVRVVVRLLVHAGVLNSSGTVRFRRPFSMEEILKVMSNRLAP